MVLGALAISAVAATTVFPGHGVGGPAMGMSGVARLGMTVAQVRALHPFAPAAVHRRRLDYDYAGPQASRATYVFRTFRRRSPPQLWSVALTGPLLETAADIGYASTDDEFRAAYPGATCTDDLLEICTLRSRRGSATTAFQFVHTGTAAKLTKVTITSGRSAR